MKYECTLCNYKTNNKSDSVKHFKTIKHNKKVTVSLDIDAISHPTSTPLPPYYKKKSQNSTQFANICKYCARSFSRPDTLSKHINTCKIKQCEENELKRQLIEHNHEFELLNLKLDKYKDESEHYKEEMNYYKKMLMEAGGLVKKSVSALTYSIQNYDMAPPIQSIQINDIDTFESSNKKTVEDVISAYKHRTMSKYIGDIILKIYKKEDPKKQSVWNTDDTRLTYLVKELLNNKSSNWIVDKKGTKTAEYLIDPLLEHIKSLIIIYQKNYSIPDINLHSTEIEMMLENNKKIVEIVNEIDDGLMAKDVLKYISSHLRFNEKHLQ